MAQLTASLATSDISFLDMASKQATLADLICQRLKPAFAFLGLSLDQFLIENISLSDELQEVMDQRIGVNLAGDLGRYTQFEAAQSFELAAANTGGAAGMGVGLGSGAAMAQRLLRPASATSGPPPAHFCVDCGTALPGSARFCPGCGKAQ